jgi:hypothetical protein
LRRMSGMSGFLALILSERRWNIPNPCHKDGNALKFQPVKKKRSKIRNCRILHLENDLPNMVSTLCSWSKLPKRSAPKKHRWVQICPKISLAVGGQCQPRIPKLCWWFWMTSKIVEQNPIKLGTHYYQ